MDDRALSIRLWIAVAVLVLVLWLGYSTHEGCPDNSGPCMGPVGQYHTLFGGFTPIPSHPGLVALAVGALVTVGVRFGREKWWLAAQVGLVAALATFIVLAVVAVPHATF